MPRLGRGTPNRSGAGVHPAVVTASNRFGGPDPAGFWEDVPDEPAPAKALTSGGGVLASNVFSPRAATVIVVFVSQDGPSAGSASNFTIADSTGALTWTRVVQTATLSRGGVAVFRAYTHVPRSAMTVTITDTVNTGLAMLIAPKLFLGADPAQVGAATGTQSTASGTPSITFTTTAAGSMTRACWFNWTNSTAPTVPGGQTATDQFATVSGDFAWAQKVDVANGAPGSVTVNATAPTAVALSGAVVEITPLQPPPRLLAQSAGYF